MGKQYYYLVQKGVLVIVNTERAKEILDRLYQDYSRKEYPYNLPGATPPQIPENMPKTLVFGTQEHAMFLFILCYWMRGGIKSHTATQKLSRLYEAYPQIFLPENTSAVTHQWLKETLQSFGLGFNAKQIANIWKDNDLRLLRNWEGDPRNIFEGISTYEEACERIRNRKKTKKTPASGFRGFQEKMVSMITYFFMDADIVDRWHFPIPVDFHVLRTVFAHEIVVCEKTEANANGFYTKPVLSAVRELFQNYCVTHSVDPVMLSEAVWLYSLLLCNEHPGNQSDVGGRHGRKTELTPVKRWSHAQKLTYIRTCQSCAIQSTCKWCVPSAEYYIRGRIVLREPREESPQDFLFSMIQ